MFIANAAHPDDVHKSLRDQSNTRMQASLDILHEVCLSQKLIGSDDFSLPTIAALLKKRKGPSYQTLRNKNPQGDRYRTLIEVWSRFSGGSMKKPIGSFEPPSMTILQKIPDPAVRGIVGSIIAENTRLKGEIHVLRQKVDYVIDRRPVQRIQQDDNGRVRTVNGRLVFRPGFATAIRKILQTHK